MAHIVQFTKTFTGGPLAGLQIAESARFHDVNLARAFVAMALERPEIKNPIGGSPYRIDEPRLVPADTTAGEQP